MVGYACRRRRNAMECERSAAEEKPAATILVVEDEPLIQLITSEALNESGYRVLVAGDADEAIGILSRDASVRLLFTDNVMPGQLDGFGLAEWAKSVRPDLKVLYTSGYSWAAAQPMAGVSMATCCASPTVR